MMNHKNLDVWKYSMDIINTVYRLTAKFPGTETFGLTAQIRRAAISVSANIAEGMGRRTKKDTSRFLHIARGSLYELDTLLMASVNQKFMSEENGNNIYLKIDSCVKMLQGLIRRYKQPDQE